MVTMRRLHMLGNRLRELRKKHNKTQAELGKLLGTDQSGYSKIENSIHSLPVSLLGILANYYRMSIDELLEFTPNNPQTDAEKALSKLDDYGIIYKIFNDGRIGILQPKNPADTGFDVCGSVYPASVIRRSGCCRKGTRPDLPCFSTG